MKLAIFKQRFALFFAAFVMAAALAHADPENFMVDQFTFVRPPKWKWVWNEKLANTGLFLVVRGANTNDYASVYFRKFDGQEGSPERRIKAWRAVFKETGDKLRVRSETKTIAAFPVVYIEMEGTSLHDTRPEFSLVAAIVKMKEGHVVIRISGRKKVVDDSKTLFKEMIERALMEKQAD